MPTFNKPDKDLATDEALVTMLASLNEVEATDILAATSETMPSGGRAQVTVDQTERSTHNTFFDLFADGHQSQHGLEVATQPDAATFQAITQSHNEEGRRRWHRKPR